MCIIKFLHTLIFTYKCRIEVDFADDPIGAGLCGALDTMDGSPQSELGGPIICSFFKIMIRVFKPYAFEDLQQNHSNPWLKFLVLALVTSFPSRTIPASNSWSSLQDRLQPPRRFDPQIFGQRDWTCCTWRVPKIVRTRWISLHHQGLWN